MLKQALAHALNAHNPATVMIVTNIVKIILVMTKKSTVPMSVYMDGNAEVVHNVMAFVVLIDRFHIDYQQVTVPHITVHPEEK